MENKISESKEVITMNVSSLSKLSQGLSIEEVEALNTKCLSLTVENINDKEGFKHVYEAHQIVKAHLKSCESDRKALKEKALNFGRLVDKTAKDFKSQLEPAAKHLQFQRDVVKREKERIELEAKERAEKLFDCRIVELRKSGALFNGVECNYADKTLPIKTIGEIHETLWIGIIEEIKEWKKIQDDIEQRRIENEKAIKAEEKAKQDAIDAENKRIADEQKMVQHELDKKQAELNIFQKEQADKLKLQQDKIDSANRKIQEEKDLILKAKQDVIRKEEEKERIALAKKEAIEEEKIRIIAKEKQAEAERIEKESQKSDAQKMKDLFLKIETLELPKVKSLKAKRIVAHIKTSFSQLLKEVKVGN